MFARQKNSVYLHLLKDPTVKQWFENNDRGSRLTATVYLNILGRYCSTYGTTPKELIEQAKGDAYAILSNLINIMEGDKKTGGYIRGTTTALKSWFAFNDVIVHRRLKIRDARYSPILDQEQVPSPPDVAKVLRSSNKKTRAIIILMAHSGIRFNSIGNSTDGLRIKDLPELIIKDGLISFSTIPTLIVIRANLSKTHRQYITFLSPEGCSYLKEYLETRIQKGEELTPESALLLCREVSRAQFISSKQFRHSVRHAIRNAGFKWRPYIFRSYFSTRLFLAEMKGLCCSEYRYYWMGHKGKVANVYTIDKGKQIPETIEDMREKYKASQDYLQTMADTPKKDGHPLKVANPEEQALYNYYAQKAKQGKKTQKLVSAKDAEKFFEDGWTFVTELKNGKVVIEKEE